MPRFRKLPVVVTAEQWFPGKPVAGVYVNVSFLDQNGHSYKMPGVRTLEGYAEVRPGDWIVTGVAGEQYPCADAIFRRSYEEVDEDG